MYTYPIVGIHQGLAAMERAARRIADFENSDPARDQVDMMIASHAVKANVQALRCQIEAGGSILDLFA